MKFRATKGNTKEKLNAYRAWHSLKTSILQRSFLVDVAGIEPAPAHVPKDGT